MRRFDAGESIVDHLVLARARRPAIEETMKSIDWLDSLPGDGCYRLRDAQSNLLQVLLPDFTLSRSDPGFALDVAFGEGTTAIRRREAKKRIQGSMPGFPDKIPGIQAEIDRVFSRRSEEYRHEDLEFCFRYASGGTLPVLEVGDVQYYCLFYRDIFPVGWNIANGACDSFPELLNPARAIERELREELMVLGLHLGEPVDYELTWPKKSPIDMPEFLDARRLAGKFLATELQIFQGFARQPLQVEWEPPGPDTLRVRFEDGEIVGRGFYLNINAHDFGIEVDRIAKIRVDSSVTLLDGEIYDNRLLNRPIGLFEVKKTQKAVYDGVTEFLPDRLFYRASLERNTPPASADELAETMIRQRFFVHLLQTGVRSAGDIERWEKVPGGERFDLCPVTRSILKRHMAAVKPRVFLSYWGEDWEFARRLQQDLRARNVEVWRDVTSMAPGERSAPAIQQAIEDSSHVVLLGSRGAKSSEPVGDELLYARQTRTPGLVVMLEDCELPLSAIQWPRVFFGNRYEEALEELLDRLSAGLGR